MRRPVPLLVPLLVPMVAAAALTGCGSDTTDGSPTSSAQAIPACSQVSSTGNNPDRVLCRGTAGATPLGRDGGTAEVTFVRLTQAPAAALAGLEIGTANDSKKGATLWYVTMRATVVKAGEDIEGSDPAGVIGLRAGDTDGKAYVGGSPDGCERETFASSAVGTAVTSCGWALLPEGAQPTELRFFGDEDLTPTLRWAARS